MLDDQSPAAPIMKAARLRPGAGSPVQYAALPYRRAATLEILLITSRETRRWVIPKGWPMKGREPHEAAAQEALEEAGVGGRIADVPTGLYRYAKTLADGSAVDVEVDVFPLAVDEEQAAWPEMDERVRRWFPAEEAAAAVAEPDLAALIAAFAAATASQG